MAWCVAQTGSSAQSSVEALNPAAKLMSQISRGKGPICTRIHADPRPSTNMKVWLWEVEFVDIELRAKILLIGS